MLKNHLWFTCQARFNLTETMGYNWNQLFFYLLTTPGLRFKLPAWHYAAVAEIQNAIWVIIIISNLSWSCVLYFMSTGSFMALRPAPFTDIQNCTVCLKSRVFVDWNIRISLTIAIQANSETVLVFHLKYCVCNVLLLMWIHKNMFSCSQRKLFKPLKCGKLLYEKCML